MLCCASSTGHEPQPARGGAMVTANGPTCLLRRLVPGVPAPLALGFPIWEPLPTATTHASGSLSPPSLPPFSGLGRDFSFP